MGSDFKSSDLDGIGFRKKSSNSALTHISKLFYLTSKIRLWIIKNKMHMSTVTLNSYVILLQRAQNPNTIFAPSKMNVSLNWYWLFRMTSNAFICFILGFYCRCPNCHAMSSSKKEEKVSGLWFSPSQIHKTPVM